MKYVQYLKIVEEMRGMRKESEIRKDQIRRKRIRMILQEIIKKDVELLECDEKIVRDDGLGKKIYIVI